MVVDKSLRRHNDESELQFIWRLCSLKDAGVLDMTWATLSEILNKELVDDESEYLGESAYRKKYQQAKMFYDEVFSKMQPDEYCEKIDAERAELQKERYRFYDQRNAYNRLLRQRSRQEELNDIITRCISEGSLKQLDYTPNFVSESDNDLMVSLNDIHYGALVDNHWQTYSSEICRRMMNMYLDKILEIATTHHSENCIVWANGDLISGNIHYSVAVTNKENVIDQIIGVSELIAGFLSELSKYFHKVTFVSVAGNHSRINPNKNKVLVEERLDNLVEWYLEARLQNFENVEIGTGGKIHDTMYLVDVRGKTYCGIHGDLDGSSANIQSLQMMAGKPVYAILTGHTHCCSFDTVQGVKVLTAGSFLGMDSYCVSKRLIGYPEQIVSVCDCDGIRCNYDIDLRVKD